MSCRVAALFTFSFWHTAFEFCHSLSSLGHMSPSQPPLASSFSFLFLSGWVWYWKLWMDIGVGGGTSGAYDCLAVLL
jgi:hypothetical protein